MSDQQWAAVVVALWGSLLAAVAYARGQLVERLRDRDTIIDQQQKDIERLETQARETTQAQQRQFAELWQLMVERDRERDRAREQGGRAR